MSVLSFGTRCAGKATYLYNLCTKVFPWDGFCCCCGGGNVGGVGKVFVSMVEECSKEEEEEEVGGCGCGCCEVIRNCVSTWRSLCEPHARYCKNVVSGQQKQAVCSRTGIRKLISDLKPHGQAEDSSPWYQIRSVAKGKGSLVYHSTSVSFGYWSRLRFISNFLYRWLAYFFAYCFLRTDSHSTGGTSNPSLPASTAIASMLCFSKAFRSRAIDD